MASELKTYLPADTQLRELFRGLIVSNNASTPDTMIDISAGDCSDSTKAYSMSMSAITKDLGSTWAVGSGNGGLDTGSLANNTWYYGYNIKRLDTGVTDCIWSTSDSAPSLPANYTIYRALRCSIQTDGAAKIKMLHQDPVTYEVWWSNGAIAGTTNEIPLDFSVTNPGISAVNRPINVPPLGVLARINITVTSNGGTQFGVNITSKATKDFAPSLTAAPLATLTVGQDNPSVSQIHSKEVQVIADTSREIRTRLGFSSGGVVLAGATVSWLEPVR